MQHTGNWQTNKGTCRRGPPSAAVGSIMCLGTETHWVLLEVAQVFLTRVRSMVIFSFSTCFPSSPLLSFLFPFFFLLSLHIRLQVKVHWWLQHGVCCRACFQGSSGQTTNLGNLVIVVIATAYAIVLCIPDTVCQSLLPPFSGLDVTLRSNTPRVNSGRYYIHTHPKQSPIG